RAARWASRWATVRAPVKSAGVVVGRVEDIDFDTETYEATVTLSIDSRYEFPKDTSAKILTAGLLGEQYIGLVAGGDTAKLKSGDKLKLTQSAVVLENLISQFLFSKAADGSNSKEGK
ncbi:MAG: outer membrane lipid asymmetry maintenance protein MlaD, partial [Burkholderiales bacterium]